MLSPVGGAAPAGHKVPRPVQDLIEALSENIHSFDAAAQDAFLARFEALTVEMLKVTSEPDIIQLTKAFPLKELKTLLAQQQYLHALNNFYLKSDTINIRHRGKLNKMDLIIPYCPDLLISFMAERDGHSGAEGTGESGSGAAAAVTAAGAGGENRIRSFSFHGACMLADISGFSRFSGDMCSKGAAGLDELREATNGFLGHFVKVVYEYGGDVIAFAGDALICVFKENAPGSATDGVDCCFRAIQCADILRNHTMEVHHLTAHIGISYGEMKVGLLGGYDDQYVFLMNGSCVKELSQCVDDANKQEIVVTPSCFAQAQHFATSLHVEGSPTGTASIKSVVLESGNSRIDSYFDGRRGRTVGAKASPVSDLRRTDGLHRGAREEQFEALSVFVPRPVLNAIASRTFDSVGELRTVTTIFLKLTSYSDVKNSDPVTLQPFFRMAQEVLHKSGGFMRQFLVDDKGCVLICMWGTPSFTYSNNCSRALFCAVSMKQRAAQLDPPHECNIGVTTGNVYCGTIGSTARLDYVGIGNEVNLAARLMSKAKGRVIVDDHTYSTLDAVNKKLLVPAETMTLKGIKNPVTPWAYDSNTIPSLAAKDDLVHLIDDSSLVLKMKPRDIGIVHELVDFLTEAHVSFKLSGTTDVRVEAIAAALSGLEMSVAAAAAAAAAASSSSSSSSSSSEAEAAATAAAAAAAKDAAAEAAAAAAVEAALAAKATSTGPVAPAGGARFCILVGMPGTGKSTIVKYFKVMLIRQNIKQIFVAGTADLLSTPYGFIKQLFNAVVDKKQFETPQQRKALLLKWVASALAMRPLLSGQRITPGEAVRVVADLLDVDIVIPEILPAARALKDESTRALSGSFHTVSCYDLRAQLGGFGPDSMAALRGVAEELFINMFTIIVRRVPVAIMLEDGQFCDESSWNLLHRWQLGCEGKVVFLISMRSKMDAFLKASSHHKSRTGTRTSGRGSAIAIQQTAQAMAAAGDRYDMHGIKFPLPASGWKIIDQENTRVIETKGMSVEDVDNYLRKFLGLSSLDAEVAQLVFDVSSGSVFWCNEIGNFLKERGVGTLDALVDIFSSNNWVMLRLDHQLTTDERDVLKQAAIISDEFTEDLVAAVVQYRNVGKKKRTPLQFGTRASATSTPMAAAAAAATAAATATPMAAAATSPATVEAGMVQKTASSKIMDMQSTDTVDITVTTAGIRPDNDSSNPRSSPVNSPLGSSGKINDAAASSAEKPSEQQPQEQQQGDEDPAGGVFPSWNDYITHHLDLFVEKGFIVCKQRLPFRVYAFQNSVIQTSLYQSIPPLKAAEIHKRVAEFYEVAREENLRPYYSRIAYHYERAHQLGNYPQAKTDAFIFYLKAADSLIAGGAMQEGLGFLEKARALVDTVEDMQILLDIVHISLIDIEATNSMPKRGSIRLRLRPSSHYAFLEHAADYGEKYVGLKTDLEDRIKKCVIHRERSTEFQWQLTYTAHRMQELKEEQQVEKAQGSQDVCCTVS